MHPRRKHFGWGREGEGLSGEETEFAFARIREILKAELTEEVKPPRLEDIVCQPPRIAPPPALGQICSAGKYDRIAHAYGQSFPDYVRGLAGDYGSAPDVVAWLKHMSPSYHGNPACREPDGPGEGPPE